MVNNKSGESAGKKIKKNAGLGVKEPGAGERPYFCLSDLSPAPGSS